MMLMYQQNECLNKRTDLFDLLKLKNNYQHINIITFLPTEVYKRNN